MILAQHFVVVIEVKGDNPGRYQVAARSDLPSVQSFTDLVPPCVMTDSGLLRAG